MSSKRKRNQAPAAEPAPKPDGAFSVSQPRKAKNLFEQMAMLNDSAPAELDPERMGEQAGDAYVVEPSYDEGFDDAEEEGGSGWGHRSKRRTGAKKFVDDPAYAGVRSSRRAFEMEASDGSGSSDDSDADLAGSSLDSDDEEDDGQDGEEDSEGDQRDSEAGSDRFGDAEPSAFESGDGISDGDGDDDETGRQPVDAEVAAQLAKLEDAERAMVTEMSEDPEAQRVKGKHTRAQLALWDAAVETRIRLQPVLQMANRLPQGDVHGDLSPDAGEAVASASNACLKTIWQLMKLKRSLFRTNPAVSNCVTKLSKARRLGLTDAEGWWGELEATHTKFRPFLDETLDKWHSKTSLAARRAKSYKSLDLSLTKQIDQAIADKSRLRARTQLARAPLDVIGADASETDEMSQGDGKGGFGTNANIFDDGDWYQSVLRDLIEKKSSSLSGDDPLSMGRQWVELNKHRVKIKKKVDTKASKGRKLRYNVIEKLVNFMAPDEAAHPSSDQARDDLFASLFQGE